MCHHFPTPCPEHLKGKKPQASPAPPRTYPVTLLETRGCVQLATNTTQNRLVDRYLQENEAVRIFGMNIKPETVESVTFKNNGSSVTVYAPEKTGPKIAGFARSHAPKDSEKST
jgi:hypothetical protein